MLYCDSKTKIQFDQIKNSKFCEKIRIPHFKIRCLIKKRRPLEQINVVSHVEYCIDPMKKLRVAGYLWPFAHDSVRKTIQFSQVTGTKKCPGLLGKTHLLDIPFWALRCFLVLRLGGVNKTITYFRNVNLIC